MCDTSIIILPRHLPYLRSIKDTKFKSDRLSQNFFELREQCLKSGKLFEDPEFPCCEKSLLIREDDVGPVEWKRPKELVENPNFIVGGISRFDIKQGNVGNCWFLSTLASLTLHPELIDRVVPSNQSFDVNYAGIFHFRFWYYGKWVDIVVDDRLPVLEKNFYLAFDYSSEKNEFWSALLEKAFAKLYGSYGALIGGFPDEAMENLTGGIAERYFLNNPTPNNLFEILKKSFESPTIIACGIFSDYPELREKGLIAAHAYSITAAVTLGSSNLVRVRNPWGNEVEWNGPWSDTSPEWASLTKDIKDELNLRRNEDGEFWMSYNDFSKYFDIVEICHFAPEQGMDRKWKEIDLEEKWKGKTAGGNRIHPTYHKNPHFKLKFTTDGNQPKTLIIALMQKNIREEKNLCFKIGFDIYKFHESNDKKRIRKEFYNDLEEILPNRPKQHFSGFREECDRFKLDSGTYSIVVCTENPNQEAEFVLRILSESGSNVEILGPKEKALIKDKIYKRGKKSFKKHCGLDGEIDWLQLQTILTSKQTTNKCFRVCMPKPVNLDVQFSEKLCRVLVDAFDQNYSGKLSRNEFICLWRDLWQWKDTFETYRKKSSELELSPNELLVALDSIGVPLSKEDFKKLLNKNEMISFDASLIYAFQLQMNGVARRLLETSV